MGCECKRKKKRCKRCVQKKTRKYKSKICDTVYTADELYALKGDAVVSITTLTHLTTSRDKCDRYPRSNRFPDGLEYGKDFITYTKQGNGWFVNDFRIVCPAQLVLLPPNITEELNLYPFEKNRIPKKRPKKNGDNMFRVDRILVTVTNVNNGGKTFIYDADLVWVDGSGDQAQLEINFECNDFNDECKAPKLDKHCHPYLCTGTSRTYKPGRKAFIIGDNFPMSQPNFREIRHNRKYGDDLSQEDLSEDELLEDYLTDSYSSEDLLENSLDSFEESSEDSFEEQNEIRDPFEEEEEEEVKERKVRNRVQGGKKRRRTVGTYPSPLRRFGGKGISEGVIYESRGIDPNGMAQQELVKVSIDGPNYASVGAPIFNEYGNVISYVTMNKIGATELVDVHVRERGRGRRRRTEVSIINPFIGNGVIAGPASKDFVYVMIKMTNAVEAGECDLPFIELRCSDFGDFFRFVRAYLGIAWEQVDALQMSMMYDRAGHLVPSYFGTCWKDNFSNHQMAGLRIRTAAGLKFPRNVIVPGPETRGTKYGTFTQTKCTEFCVNDILLCIEDCFLGNQGDSKCDGQVTISQALKKKEPGDCVDVRILTLGKCKDSCRNKDGYSERCEDLIVQTVEQPAWMAFPWYSYHQYKLNNIPIIRRGFNEDLPMIKGRYMLPAS